MKNKIFRPPLVINERILHKKWAHGYIMNQNMIKLHIMLDVPNVHLDTKFGDPSWQILGFISL